MDLISTIIKDGFGPKSTFRKCAHPHQDSAQKTKQEIRPKSTFVKCAHPPQASLHKTKHGIRPKTIFEKLLFPDFPDFPDLCGQSRSITGLGSFETLKHEIGPKSIVVKCAHPAQASLHKTKHEIGPESTFVKCAHLSSLTSLK